MHHRVIKSYAHLHAIWGRPRKPKEKGRQQPHQPSLPNAHEALQEELAQMANSSALRAAYKQL